MPDLQDYEIEHDSREVPGASRIAAVSRDGVLWPQLGQPVYDDRAHGPGERAGLWTVNGGTMDQQKLELVIGEMLTEIAIAPGDIPRTVQAVLAKELSKVWRDGYNAGIAAARKNNIRPVG